MSSCKLDSDPIGSRIASAFGEDYGSWHTPGGLARAAGLDPHVVQSYLNAHPQLFRRSPLTLSGTPLYSLRPEVIEV